MKQADRQGRIRQSADGQEKLLRALYGHAAGRAFLKLLIAPPLSRAAGWMLSTRLSTVLIKPFIRQNGIDMSQFEPGPFESYNAFFARRILPGMRPVDEDPAHLIAPCDSKLTALPIAPESRFVLKNTPYTLSSLLRDEQLASRYAGGTALIFRLTVDDYHRYCYVADGEKGENVRIPGVLHTVNPIANDVYPIYKENAREYSLLQTERFGSVLMMEVGALLVGRIVNHHAGAQVKRGEEKGYFQFGGSTVVLLLEKGAAKVDGDILRNSEAGIETIVRMGERIGCAV